MTAGGCLCLFMAYYSFNYTLNGIHSEATVKNVRKYKQRTRRKRPRWERRLRFEYTFIDRNNSGHYESADFPRSRLTDSEQERLKAGEKMEIVYLPGVAGSSKPAFLVHESMG